MKSTMNRNRVAVFIDGSDLFFYQKQNNLNWQIDSLALVSWIGKNLGKISSVNYYASSDPQNAGQIRFHDFLRHNGFNVFTREVRVIESYDEKNQEHYEDIIKANYEYKVVFDILSMIDSYDHLVYVGSKNEIIDTLQYVRNQGKELTLIAPENIVSVNVKEKFMFSIVDMRTLQKEISRA